MRKNTLSNYVHTHLEDKRTKVMYSTEQITHQKRHLENYVLIQKLFTN